MNKSITKENRMEALSKYLKINKEDIKQFDDEEYYFEIPKSNELQGWNVYTKEEREKYARINFKEMIADECYTHYADLSEATGFNIENLKIKFEPYVKDADYTIENVYEFLIENNALDKYIDIVLADESFDHYKEQLSLACFEGGEQDGFYIYQWGVRNK